MIRRRCHHEAWTTGRTAFRRSQNIPVNVSETFNRSIRHHTNNITRPQSYRKRDGRNILAILESLHAIAVGQPDPALAEIHRSDLLGIQRSNTRLNDGLPVRTSPRHPSTRPICPRYQHQPGDAVTGIQSSRPTRVCRSCQDICHCLYSPGAKSRKLRPTNVGGTLQSQRPC